MLNSLYNSSIVFDSQFLTQAVYFRFRTGDLPVPCRNMNGAYSIKFGQSVIYGLTTIKTLFQFILQRSHLMKCDIFEF